MTDLWKGEWRGLDLRIEVRSLGSTGGSTLRIGPSADGDVEWLRFDCFDEGAHWHLAPSGRDEIQSLDSELDPVSETLAMLARDLPGLLDRAGAPASVVAEVRQAGDTAEKQRLFHQVESYLRHRPAVLDDVDPRQLERRRTSKWRQYPADVLPAWVAEMDFPLAAPIEAELRRFSEISDLGYPLDDEDTGFGLAFSERMQTRFGWAPDPARIEPLAEVVQGLYIAVEAFSEPGEGIVVQTPIYPPFLTTVHDTGRRLVDNAMHDSGTRFEFDLDALAAQIDPTTRVFLLCNPHNPSGRVMLRSDLERIAQLALERDLIVISDEIHADLLYDDHVHIPFATLGPEIAARTVTLTSTSKAFNIPGLRSAVAHFGSAALQDRFNARHPARVRGGLGLLGLYASIAAWRFGQPWLDEVVPYLQANRDFAKQALAERIPEIGFHSPEATYLAWLDCSALDIQGSPTQHFMKQGRVALSSGHRFGPAWSRYTRLNFATSRAILGQVIERMAKALGR